MVWIPAYRLIVVQLFFHVRPMRIKGLEKRRICCISRQIDMPKIIDTLLRLCYYKGEHADKV